jgi:hypothetical protein
LLLAQGVGLLFQESLQGALGESDGGSTGDLLHGVPIDLEAGAVVAQGAFGDDFTPAGGEVLKFLQVLRVAGRPSGVEYPLIQARGNQRDGEHIPGSGIALPSSRPGFLHPLGRARPLAPEFVILVAGKSPFPCVGRILESTADEEGREITSSD